jgi:hypothetical protein
VLGFLDQLGLDVVDVFGAVVANQCKVGLEEGAVLLKPSAGNPVAKRRQTILVVDGLVGLDYTCVLDVQTV